MSRPYPFNIRGILLGKKRDGEVPRGTCTSLVFSDRRKGKKYGFFIFIFFLISFFINIYFRSQNLQKYTPAAPLSGGRHLVAPLPGGRGFSAKVFAKNLGSGPWRTGRPAAGRQAPAARQRGDRLPEAAGVCFTKNSEKNSRFVVILFI